MRKTLPFLLALTLPLGAAGAQAKFEFEIETLGGQKLSHEDFKNNLVIVDFWGTWCDPCVKSVPGLVKLYGKYKHHGLEIIGLNYREKGSKEEVLARIRDFAAENGITYTLAIGTKKIQDQIAGFAGYPTVLFFKKGMKFDHMETEFDPEGASKMEKWIRAELGLDKASAKGGEEAEAETAKEPKEKTKIPDGVIYKPGDHDSGFAFTVHDTEGKEVNFSDFRGKKVVLALTSTWDEEAVATARLLNQVHEKWSEKGVVVLAASMELKTDRDLRLRAIAAFKDKHKPTYALLPVGLTFLKKVHKPGGFPLFLVFDEKGVLVLRLGNDVKDKLAKIGDALS